MVFSLNTLLVTVFTQYKVHQTDFRGQLAGLHGGRRKAGPKNLLQTMRDCATPRKEQGDTLQGSISSTHWRRYTGKSKASTKAEPKIVVTEW